MPGGRAQEGEATREALIRELREELGAECTTKYTTQRPVFFHENFFRHDGKHFHEVCVYYNVELPEGVAAFGEVSAADGGLCFMWAEVTQLAKVNLQPSFLASHLRRLPVEPQYVVSRK